MVNPGSSFEQTWYGGQAYLYYKLILEPKGSGELTIWFYHGVLHPKDADGMANSEDQSDLLFAQICPSEDGGWL